MGLFSCFGRQELSERNDCAVTFDGNNSKALVSERIAATTAAKCVPNAALETNEAHQPFIDALKAEQRLPRLRVVPAAVEVDGTIFAMPALPGAKSAAVTTALANHPMFAGIRVNCDYPGNSTPISRRNSGSGLLTWLSITPRTSRHASRQLSRADSSATPAIALLPMPTAGVVNMLSVAAHHLSYTQLTAGGASAGRAAALSPHRSPASCGGTGGATEDRDAGTARPRFVRRHSCLSPVATAFSLDAILDADERQSTAEHRVLAGLSALSRLRSASSTGCRSHQQEHSRGRVQGRASLGSPRRRTSLCFPLDAPQLRRPQRQHQSAHKLTPTDMSVPSPFSNSNLGVNHNGVPTSQHKQPDITGGAQDGHSGPLRDSLLFSSQHAQHAQRGSRASAPVFRCSTPVSGNNNLLFGTATSVHLSPATQSYGAYLSALLDEALNQDMDTCGQESSQWQLQGFL